MNHSRRLESPSGRVGPAVILAVRPSEKARGAINRSEVSERSGLGRSGKPTLTNLDNERRTLLDLAHKELDIAVAAAYGWPTELADEEILARRLKLNLERAWSSDVASAGASH